MNGVTVALSQNLADELMGALSDRRETAAVLVARAVSGPGQHLTLLVRALHWVPDDAYGIREPTGLTVTSPGWVPALGAAHRDGSVAVWVHTHPGASPAPSDHDRLVDEQLAGPFTGRTHQRLYGSLVVGGTPDRPRFDGTFRLGDGSAQPLRAVRSAGRQLRLWPREDPAKEPAVEAFDRQVRAFGADGQAILAALIVGVVGLGGTGSSAAEMLLRLGVGQMVAIDAKTLTSTNATRVYGSGVGDTGQLKTDLVRRNAQRIGLGTDVTPVEGKVIQQHVASALRHCDVVFGCTDDNAGRAILSRLAYWYLIPVIDMGVGIDTADGHIDAVLGRVTTISPGTACLQCRGRIDPALAYAEHLDPEERGRMAAQGYVPGLGQPDPAVVAFTTLVAASAVNEMLAGLFGYGPSQPSSELLLQIDARRISRNSQTGQAAHYCSDSDLLGAGDTDDPLGIQWT